ncbi:MAG: type II secretion system inner membrane protein GspF [Gammaproteobacteria bacterium]|nr:type II secretion system inner membrane protein GspF [Gammaproteobacteria bacterium]
MGAFQYQVLDQKGRKRSGVIEGDTARQIRQHLKGKGWMPLSVEQVEGRQARTHAVEGGRKGLGLRSRSLGAKDHAMVTRQLATLLGSGLPVESALATVAEQTDKDRVKATILGVRAKVLEGYPLAKAMADFPQSFNTMYRATVAAGERSGHLENVLTRLADYAENQQRFRQTLSQSLMYPILVILISLGVVGVLMTYVVPKVVTVFETTGQTLPLLTRSLIGISDFLLAYWWLLLGGAGAFIVALLTWLSSEENRHRFHRFLLRLPVLSKVIMGVNTARFSRTLSILNGSGVPIVEGMNIAASVMGNLSMRRSVEEAARRVREGSSIHAALRHSGYFPPMTQNLIASGESSGKLEAMLDKAAEIQEREMETSVGMFVSIFEPVMILLMGVMVLIIVLSILLPILDMNSLVGS